MNLKKYLKEASIAYKGVAKLELTGNKVILKGLRGMPNRPFKDGQMFLPVREDLKDYIKELNKNVRFE